MASLLKIKLQTFDINKLKVIIKDSRIKLNIDSCHSDKVRVSKLKKVRKDLQILCA